jgi:hypothetical protein
VSTPSNEAAPIRAWILEAGEIPSPDPGDHGARLPLCALVQFESIEAAQAATRGEPITLGWIWDKPK